MTAYFIHQHQSRAMEPRRHGRNAKHNYPLRLTAPILANYYVEVRFYMSLGVKKKFFLVRHSFLYASTL